MARRRCKILRIIGWVFLGFCSLIALVSLVFYLNRGRIKERALNYLNELQPGHVTLGKINLIPFLNFPRGAIQLKNVGYYESYHPGDSPGKVPILSLEEIFVSLDLIELIRGDLSITRAWLGDGDLRIVLYEDTVTNLENALGIRFGEHDREKKAPGLPGLRIDLDRLQMSNMHMVMWDRIRDHHLDLVVNSLENRFVYLPEKVETDIKLDVEVRSINYLSISSETRRQFQFESDLTYDIPMKKISINPSSMTLSGLMLEVWGSCDLLDEPYLDLGFRATNTGLDVLNFLLRGILDLDEIEQIGSGSLCLDGEVTGYAGKTLPLIKVNATADRIGFRIKSLRKDVTDISFRAFASNGIQPDMSDGVLTVESFSAKFPEGDITGRFTAKNKATPEVDIEVNGDVELNGLEHMIKSDPVTDLTGQVNVHAHFRGLVDQTRDDFMNDAGMMTAQLTGVGFVIGGDTLEKINGEVFIRENILGSRDLDLQINGNRLLLEARAENVIHYLLGFDRDVRAEVRVASDRIHTARLLRDTSLVNLLGDEIVGLHFRAGARIGKRALDAFLKHDSVPQVLFSLDSFGAKLPVYAGISDLSASLKLGPDTLELYRLGGMIGESGFGFSGKVVNFGALGRKDSTALVSVEYNLSSALMRAEDIFTYRNDFMLPASYRTEYLENFHLAGSARVPVAVLLDENASFDFDLDISDMGWKLRYYPLVFDQFIIRARKTGDLLSVDDFRGSVGESNLRMTASLDHITDSLKNLTGHIKLESDMLDYNELFNYQSPEEFLDSTGASSIVKDSLEMSEPPRLDQFDYPSLSFDVDIDEMRFGTYRIFGIAGSLRSTHDRIFYLDNLAISPGSGGQIAFNGLFNVSSPLYYTFSAEFDLKEVNVNELDFEMTWGEESYTLKENFEGLVTAKGIAEIFITPDLSFDIATSTAVFDVNITDGALINFTPLQAAARYLDNKDLNHIRFASLRNRFTLVDSRIMMPLMSVGSSVGQLLLEGEQGLDNSYLYLIRIPTWLVRDAAKSVLTHRENEQDAEQIYEMKTGKFLVLTAWSDGQASEIKTGDKRDRYQQ